jgi:hypothetical protein
MHCNMIGWQYYLRAQKETLPLHPTHVSILLEQNEQTTRTAALPKPPWLCPHAIKAQYFLGCFDL